MRSGLQLFQCTYIFELATGKVLNMEKGHNTRELKKKEEEKKEN